MFARRPSARGEPAPEAVGQERSRFKRREGQGIGRRHGEEVSRPARFVEGYGGPNRPAVRPDYSVTGLSEMSQSLPLKIEM